MTTRITYNFRPGTIAGYVAGWAIGLTSLMAWWDSPWMVLLMFVVAHVVGFAVAVGVDTLVIVHRARRRRP